MAAQVTSSSPRLTDKKLFNRLLDEKGIDADADWRVFCNFLFIQQQAHYLTSQQKKMCGS